MSTERDDLARTIRWHLTSSINDDQAQAVAQVLLAAGYRKLSDRCTVCGRLIGSNGVTCHADPKHEGYYICCIKIDGDN